MKTEEKITTYVIPENFIEGGRVLNGMFKMRNFMEGAILGGGVALFSLLLPIESFSTRISVVLGLAMPFFLLGVMGINDDPLSVFLKNALTWRKGKGIMLYNHTPQPRDAQAVDMMMAEPMARDRIISAYEAWGEKRKQEENQRRKKLRLEFEEDSELKKLKSAQQRAESKMEKGVRRTKVDMQAVSEIDDLDELNIDYEVYEAEDTMSITSDREVYLPENLYTPENLLLPEEENS